jgi:serine-type D-Ala-D-Ala carboxypeptidase
MLFDSHPDGRELTQIAESIVADGVAPCAVVAAGVRGGADGEGAAGWLWGEAVAPDAPEASVRTVFDLASLTKPVTALCFARLEKAGVVARGETLAALLGGRIPEIARGPSADVPLDLLMAHRAGLVAHNPFYEALIRGERPTAEDVLAQAAAMRRPECHGPPPADGFAPVYSDLGYLLIGAALEARTGRALDELMEAEVLARVAPRMAIGSVRRLDSDARARIAPTEVVAWRGGLVRAAVHDENAWLIAGEGAAGHAGLFAEARAVQALGLAVLDVLAGESDWLDPGDLEPLIRPRPGGSHAAGFDRRSVEPGATPASGAHFGPRTFGHLGFTGTSLWIDPDGEMVGVLLTNRVCPTRHHWAIRQARPVAYDAIFRALSSSRKPQ